MIRAAVLLSLSLLLLESPAARAQAGERVSAVLHVHSTLSTGDLPLEELASVAEREGIQALFLAENYLLRIEYGVPPFRALTRVVREERSILHAGPDRYLARVAEVRRLFPRLVVVPGVEIIPHYHWTGSPLGLQMTLHNTQKNILVFGVSDPAALARLPSAGNVRAGRLTAQTVLDALPTLLLLPGAWLTVTKRPRRVRVGRAVMVVRQRRWLLGGVFIAIGIAALIRGWPFTTDPYPSWTDPGLAPHQDLIDHVDRLGGVTVWSFPDARDAGEHQVGPVQVRWHTEPYADDLLRTFNYTAFGGIYEDTTRFERPGHGWDTVLTEYVRGERSRPAWAVGESGFHGFRAGKHPANVHTVFLDAERSETGLLDAFKRGRMYALQRTRAAALVLTEFAVLGDGAAAGSGGEIRAPVGAPLEVRIGIDASGGSQPIRLALVKNGTVAAGWTGTTPFQVVHRETFDGAPAFFRVDVWGGARNQHLLTNPIFVRPA